MARASRRTQVVAAAIAVGIMAVGIFFVPQPPTLASTRTGDQALAERLHVLVAEAGGVRHTVSAAVIDADGVRYAGLGASETDEFEIGSITKTFTARLLALAVERGEVSLDTPVGELLDLGDSAAAEVTLEELSTHTSGLPRLPGGVEMFARGWWSAVSGSDPYGGYTLDQLLAAARSAELSGRGEVSYSNLGVALLGNALAAAADTDYPSLLEERVLVPLRMDATYDPVAEEELREGAPRGFTEGGQPADAWTMGAYGPAGAIRSTTADMVRYVQAVLSDDLGVTEPRFQDPEGGDVGLAWFTTDIDGDSVAWHNGGTGGYRSMVAVDRANGRAAIVLSDTAVAVDSIAIDLLQEARS